MTSAAHRYRVLGALAIALIGLAGCGTDSAASEQSDELTSSAPAAKPTTTPNTSETSDSPATSSDSASPTTEVWEDNGMVSHIFFHSLVVDTDRAFDGDSQAAGYLDYMVTVEEFNAVLEDVYSRDYVLISPHDLYTVDNTGTLSPTPLELPAGKKPLVMSFDDLSYYEYMEGDGFADRLVFDNGRVSTEYTDAAGQTHVGHYDYVPILDDFVEEHPDFSHQGAKGVIALTGYNGIFGYRTSDSVYGEDNPDIEYEQWLTTALAQVLKDNGWEFASHSWGHISFTQSSADRIAEDHERWSAEVEPLIGHTDLLIYPFGADISGVADYSGAKFDYLKGQGFNAFFNVDASVPAWGQFRDDYLRQARINVDGISLKNAVDGRWEALREFFDPEDIIDPARPASIAGNN